MLQPAIIAMTSWFALQAAPTDTATAVPSSSAPADAPKNEQAAESADAAPPQAPPDEEQAERLLDRDDPRAQEGVVVGARGIDPGWKDSRVAERSPNMFGQTGLRRINSARAGKSGYFDIGISGRAFQFSDFIAPGTDANTFAVGTGHFGVTLFDMIELGIAAHFASNENTIARPATLFSSGDLSPSIKFAYTLLPVAFGLDVRGFFPTSQDQVGVDFANFSVNAMGLFTADLYEAYDLPFRLHANLGYTYQNAHTSGANQYFARDLPGHLLAMTTGQWYYDQLVYGLGLEAPLPYVTPYVELWGQMALDVPTGFGPEGADYGFGDSMLIATPGLRFAVGRGLSVDLAADLGLLGTGGGLTPDVAKLTPGQPINPAYAVHLGVSYTFSPFVAETQVEVREKERPLGQVSGCVVDANSGAKIEEAFVEFTGTTGPRIVVDERGCFVSPQLEPGTLLLRVKHPEFEPSETSVEILADQVATTQVPLKPAPRFGQFKGVVTNDKDLPVNAVLEVQSTDGKSTEHTAAEGEFTVPLAPGRYQVVVKADGYLQQGAAVLVEPLGKTIRNFVLKPLPTRRLSLLTKDKIEISTRIPFEFNKARLLRAAEFILDDAVDLLLSNPQVKLVRIEGYTDDSGGVEYNQKLSEARAQSVMEYLVGKGVPQDRLVAEGFGATRPIAPNDSEEGRAKNRRVEFVIVDQGEGSTGASGGSNE